MSYLVTGCAGFIGYHTTEQLLSRGDTVVGLDNLNDYYDPTLKQARLKRLQDHDGFRFVKLDLVDQAGIAELFRKEQFQRVIHLAAQAGVRHSLTYPQVYVDSNVTGTLSILEGCRYNDVEHLTFASTSSVYGANRKMPFSASHGVDHPLAVYAATKKATEHLAHSYAHLYRLPCTGLRFFTVYGPWGRPDMALFLFTKNILAGRPIEVFGHGEHVRDFTYVDDIVQGVLKASDHVAAPDPDWDPYAPDPSRSDAPYRIYNIGAQQPIHLMRYIELLEQELGTTAEKLFLPLQPGDVPSTESDCRPLCEEAGYAPTTPVEVGIKRFVEWYRSYYQC